VSDDALGRWSAAEVALMLAWAALAVGLLGWAMARASLGAGLLGACALWMLCSAWSAGPVAPPDRRGL
jgi:hypothetical protein